MPLVVSASLRFAGQAMMAPVRLSRTTKAHASPCLSASSSAARTTRSAARASPKPAGAKASC
eukprot:7945805-Pyramimonas_sp.AAC.1